MSCSASAFVGGVVRVVEEVFQFHDGEPLPVFFARRRYVEQAVFGFKDTIRIDRRMIVAGLTRHIAAAEIALALTLSKPTNAPSSDVSTR